MIKLWKKLLDVIPIIWGIMITIVGTLLLIGVTTFAVKWILSMLGVIG